MGFFDGYWRRRVSHTGRESVATLSYMEDFFQGGTSWTQGVYDRPDGTKCLVGAANHVRVSAIDDAKHWLRQAIAEREPGMTTIEAFNDTRSSYTEIGTVIARAKQLAAAAQLPAPKPTPRLALPAPPMVGEILPPTPHPASARPNRVAPAPSVDFVEIERRVADLLARQWRPSLFDWRD